MRPDLFKIKNTALRVGFGSGFLIKNNLVLTCAHCVKSIALQSPLTLEDENSLILEGKLLAVDPIVDLALIKLEEPYSNQHAIFTSDCTKLNKVRILGFNSFYKEKRLDKTGEITSKDEKRYVFKGEKIHDGYSGGPLLNEDNGCVMGIVDISLNPNMAEGGAAIRNDVIDNFCRGAGTNIDYELSENQKISSILYKEIQKELEEIDEFFPRIVGSGEVEMDFMEFNRVLYSDKKKCSIIWGIGGLGKSILLKRIISHYTKSDTEGFHIYLDVKNWDSDRNAEIKRDSDYAIRIEQLLMGFDSPFNTKQFESSDKKIYIYLDGMNEFGDAELRIQVLDVLRQISRLYNAIVIATSRNIDREVKGWLNYNIKKIEKSALKDILLKKLGRTDYPEKTLDYLSIPFFLNIVLHTDSADIKSYSDFIYKHTLKNIPDTQKEEVMKALSRITFENYFTPTKFKFPSKTISSLPKELRITEEILRKKDDHYEFEHHLIYEFFVANELAQKKENWNKNTYDMTSLDNKMSFELMQMTLEQISSTEDGEQFLLSLYDWSFYATLHCLWYVDSKEKYPEEIAKALILILSEKLYDRFMHTRIQVIRHLERLYNKFTIIGLTNNFDRNVILSLDNRTAASKYREIVIANASSFMNNKYKEWYLFFSQLEIELKEGILLHINNPNPIWGWSASNLARRYKYSNSNELQLRTMLNCITDNIVRWRIVHAMGVCSQQASISILLEIFTTDEYKWVKYGTIRSLVEISLFKLDNENATVLLHNIFESFKSNIFEESIANEFRSCLATRMDSGKAKIVDYEMSEFRNQPLDSDTENKWRETYELFRKYNYN